MLLMSALKSKSKHKILRLRRHSPSPHCGVRDRLHFKAEGVVYVVKKVKVWKEESRGLPVSRWRPPRVRSNLKIDAAELRRAALSNGCEVCAKSKDQPSRPELNKNHMKRVYSGCPKPRKKLISDRICCKIRRSTKRERPLSFLNWSGHEGRRTVHARRQHPLKTHPRPAPCDKEQPMWHILSRTKKSLVDRKGHCSMAEVDHPAELLTLVPRPWVCAVIYI